MNISAATPYQAVSSVSNYSASTQAAPSTNSTSDTVSISAQGKSLSQQDHHLKTDPVEIFMEWKEKGGAGAEIGFKEKPVDKLLPQNQTLIAQLKEQEKTASPEEIKLIKSSISTIRQYGDQEIFTSAADADKRLNAQSQACSLELAYSAKKYGASSIIHKAPSEQPETQWLGSMSNADRNSELYRSIQHHLNNISLNEFNNPKFLREWLNQAYGSDYYQQPLTTKAPWES